MLNAIDGIAAAFTGGKGFKIGELTIGNGSGGGRIPGFASGGAMRIGGFAGIDRNILSLNGQPMARVSAGETMQIHADNDRGGGGTPVVFDLRGAVMTEDLLRQMNQMAGAAVENAAPALMQGGAALATSQMSRRAGRRLD